MLQLSETTTRFFSLHWRSDELGQPPAWKTWEPFLYGSVPNFDLGGCYALFSSGRLVYVGSGVSRGGGIYVGHGISRRLMSHVICSDRVKGAEWSRLREKWSHITGLCTIGFSAETVYLAPALENYLIRTIPGLGNSRV